MRSTLIVNTLFIFGLVHLIGQNSKYLKFYNSDKSGSTKALTGQSTPNFSLTECFS